jgi:hypothetical protein
VQKPRLVYPFSFVDQQAVHQRDLPGGAAEPDAPDLEPDAQGLRERDSRRRPVHWGAPVCER